MPLTQSQMPLLFSKSACQAGVPSRKHTSDHEVTVLSLGEPLKSEGDSKWILEDVGLALTVAGTLNPGILHPQWFAREGLLRPSEAADAKVELAADDYLLFRTRDFTTEASRDS